MSLNEHVQHVCSKNKYTTSSGNYLIDPSASFDLITAETCMSPVQQLEEAKDSSMDTILAQQHEDCAIQVEANFQLQLVNNLASRFVKCTEMINAQQCFNNSPSTSSQKQPPVAQTPIIITSQDEQYFYYTFTSQIPNNLPSQHIFQVDDVWIDKRTLALSMRSGCWFNHFAMFAFCKMLNHQQKERLKCRQQNREELTCFYMNKKITVFVPCVHNHQWFGVVANFNEKIFDILNSDYGIGDYQHIINKVIYNFKCLFLLAYPHCIHFNIRDFKPCYIVVPKQIFRYDSGIFLLRFMQSYDGTTVQKI